MAGVESGAAPAVRIKTRRRGRDGAGTGLLVLRRLSATVGVLVVCGAILLAAAVVIDDKRIDADRATATALVTEVSSRRAAVAFNTENGQHVRPPAGVFFPTGLAEGQRIQVDYRRANPSLVRVSGRSWTVAVWPIASVVLGVGVPCLALFLVSGRLLRRRATGSSSAVNRTDRDVT